MSSLQYDGQLLRKKHQHGLSVEAHPMARAYYQHHVSCPPCIAAGKGSRYGARCDAGQALWDAYDQAAEAAS